MRHRTISSATRGLSKRDRQNRTSLAMKLCMVVLVMLLNTMLAAKHGDKKRWYALRYNRTKYEILSRSSTGALRKLKELLGSEYVPHRLESCMRTSTRATFKELGTNAASHFEKPPLVADISRDREIELDTMRVRHATHSAVAWDEEMPAKCGPLTDLPNLGQKAIKLATESTPVHEFRRVLIELDRRLEEHFRPHIKDFYASKELVKDWWNDIRTFETQLMKGRALARKMIRLLGKFEPAEDVRKCLFDENLEAVKRILALYTHAENGLRHIEINIYWSAIYMHLPGRLAKLVADYANQSRALQLMTTVLEVFRIEIVDCTDIAKRGDKWDKTYR